jgi:Cellulase (glycosyl hydrolase family 5)
MHTVRFGPPGTGGIGRAEARRHRVVRRRRRTAAVLLVVVFVSFLVLASVLGSRPAQRSSGDPVPNTAITTSGDQILRAGRPWWLVGYNSFVWSGDCGLPAEMMSAEQVDAWFASMRHDGHGAVRLFFFRGWNIARLDAAVASARRNNVYLTITLANGIDGCGEAAKTAAWFDDPGERRRYVEHLTSLVTRYRGDPTIAWFEYFNEPGYADGRLRTFYDQMGAIAHGIDPGRLFSSGTVAPYWFGGDAAFLAVSQSPGVDIASLHEYDYTEAESNHGPAVRADSAGKPVIVGEFGVVDPATAAEADCRDEAEGRSLRVQRKLDAYLSTPGYVGAFAWAWQPGSRPAHCPQGGLDADPATQQVLRDIER